jgi:Flp pilus assembly protein TadD
MQVDPNYANAYNDRGVTYEVKRDYDLAIADYTKAIELDPNRALFVNNRGRAYCKKR